MEAACAATRPQKAPSLDGMPPDVLRLPEVQLHLLPILKEVYATGHPPIEFLRDKVIHIPKKGDLTDRDNYRGVVGFSQPTRVKPSCQF
jgi:hypothetical protein